MFPARTNSPPEIQDEVDEMDAQGLNGGGFSRMERLGPINDVVRVLFKGTTPVPRRPTNANSASSPTSTITSLPTAPLFQQFHIHLELPLLQLLLVVVVVVVALGWAMVVWNQRRLRRSSYIHQEQLQQRFDRETKIEAAAEQQQREEQFQQQLAALTQQVEILRKEKETHYLKQEQIQEEHKQELSDLKQKLSAKEDKSFRLDKIFRLSNNKKPPKNQRPFVQENTEPNLQQQQRSSNKVDRIIATNQEISESKRLLEQKTIEYEQNLHQLKEAHAIEVTNLKEQLSAQLEQVEFLLRDCMALKTKNNALERKIVAAGSQQQQANHQSSTTTTTDQLEQLKELHALEVATLKEQLSDQHEQADFWLRDCMALKTKNKALEQSLVKAKKEQQSTKDMAEATTEAGGGGGLDEEVSVITMKTLQDDFLSSEEENITELQSREDKIIELEEKVADAEDLQSQLSAKISAIRLLRSQNDRLKQTNKDLKQQIEEKKKTKPATTSAGKRTNRCVSPVPERKLIGVNVFSANGGTLAAMKKPEWGNVPQDDAKSKKLQAAWNKKEARRLARLKAKSVC